ncbi:hypothetical protein [Enterococcus sp. AZ109]|uniref:hypothetical protein n=1 Tax=Enterococcus sp. AZ109 TaxID=2774634 RepID=UPI003F26BCC8
MKIVKFVIYLACVVSLGVLGVYLYNAGKDVDTVAPVITVPEESLHLNVNSTDHDLLKDVVAKDNNEGDISNSVFVDKISKGADEQANMFDVSYVAMDEQLNVAEATRKLVYEDYHPPRFSIKKPLEVTSDLELELRDLVTISDLKDGDITPSMRVEGEGIGNVEIIPGNYNVTLKVTNSLGDQSELPVTVKVKSTVTEEGPRIKLTDYVVYLPLNTPIEPNSYLTFVEDGKTLRVANGASDEALGEGEPTEGVETIEASSITYSSNVDPSVPGIYQVVYQYQSPTTNLTGSTTLYVCVERGQ